MRHGARRRGVTIAKWGHLNRLIPRYTPWPDPKPGVDPRGGRNTSRGGSSPKP